MISPNCAKGAPGSDMGWHELCESKETCECPHHSYPLQFRYPLKRYENFNGERALLAGNAYATAEGWEVIYATNVTTFPPEPYENYIYDSPQDSVADGWIID